MKVFLASRDPNGHDMQHERSLFFSLQKTGFREGKTSNFTFNTTRVAMQTYFRSLKELNFINWSMEKEKNGCEELIRELLLRGNSGGEAKR